MKQWAILMSDFTTMQRVDFYILKTTSYGECYPFACQLANKVYPQRKSMIVQTDSTQAAKQFNELLWTFREDSFIPHQLGENPHTVVVGDIGNPTEAALLNLSIEEDPPTTQAERVLQIVPNHSKLLLWARAHYRHYQAQGITIKTHKFE